MDDACWPRSADVRFARPVQRPPLPLCSILAWPASVWPGLPDWWRPEYGWLAGAGVACLMVAWALAVTGARRGAASLPPGGRAPRPLRTRRSHGTLTQSEARRPSMTMATLHLLSGPTPERTLHGALALAAELLDRGERVLLVDGGRRLELHTVFGRESRWGLGECLSGAMPLLGVVQDSGCAGLYLLARGGAGGAEQWRRIGTLVDDARAHFGHVVMLLDPACPAAAGEALKGRLIEGWWAGVGALPRAALALSERTSIPFHGLDLSGSSKHLLELMWSRPPAVAPLSLPLAAVTTDELTLSTPALEPGLSLLNLAPPPVLDCDLRVRERLRFLIWMRRLVTQAQADSGLPMAGAASGA